MAVKKSPAKSTKASAKPARKAAPAKSTKAPAPPKRPLREAPARAGKPKPTAVKSTARKAVSKKTAVTKAPPAKAAPPKATRKAATKPAVKSTKVAKKSAPARTTTPKTDEAATNAVADRNRERHTPPVFKVPSKKGVPIVFSLDDVREVLKSRKATPAPFATGTPAKAKPASKATTPASAPEPTPGQIEIRKLGAASLADLLGGRATARKPIGPYDEAKVPHKWKRYFKLLIELRQHVIEGLELHTQDTLLRSSREDSGDLSGYGQHMADAGTETFDRDFALSLVSSEQEALAEIEAALGRIFSGTYGVCEITGAAISRERLEAVPFTRYSLEGQAEFERQHRRHVHRGGLFLDASVEDAANFSEDDGDE